MGEPIYDCEDMNNFYEFQERRQQILDGPVGELGGNLTTEKSHTETGECSVESADTCTIPEPQDRG